MLLGLLSWGLLLAGCGQSSTSAVHTGTHTLTGANGNLTFQFLAPQNQAVEAPEGSSQVRFEMFDLPGQTGQLVDLRTATFATTMTLENVSAQTQSIRVTLLDTYGIPLEILENELEVPGNQTTVVDLTTFKSTVPSLDALLVIPQVLFLNTGEQANLSVVAKFGNGASVVLSGQPVTGLSYQPQAQGIVSVDDLGSVTATASGVTELSVTLNTNGRTRTTSIPVLVDQPQLAFQPQSVILPIGGLRYAPVITSNGLPVDPSDYDFTTSNQSVARVTNGVITSGPSVGSATITVRDRNNTNIFAEAQVTTVDATITGVTTSVTDFSLYVSDSADIEATASLSNGDTMISAQNSPDLDVLVGQDLAALVDRKLVALNATGFPPTRQTIQIGFNSGTAQSLGLTVREVQLTGTELRLGGLGPGDTGYGSLPQGQYGVVELEGIFEDGSRRLLKVNEEYTAASSNNALVPFTVGVDKLNGRLDGVPGTAGSTTTVLTIELDNEISGALEVPAGPDLTLNVSITDGSSITNARFSFQNYAEDLSSIVYPAGPVFRPYDVRADFTGVPNFRIAGDNLDPIAEPPSVPPGALGNQFVIRCLGAVTPFEWRTDCCYVRSDLSPVVIGANPRLAYRISRLTADARVRLGDTDYLVPQIVTPTSVSIAPGSATTELGRRVSFQTLVDYGDGRGPLVRTLDYPVLESSFDETTDVYAVFDSAAESNTFFFKKTSDVHGSNFIFRTFDATLSPLRDTNPNILDSIYTVARRL